MKNATATNHGKSRLLEADGADRIAGALVEFTRLTTGLVETAFVEGQARVLVHAENWCV
jgi:hypothetical protein